MVLLALLVWSVEVSARAWHKTMVRGHPRVSLFGPSGLLIPSPRVKPASRVETVARKLLG